MGEVENDVFFRCNLLYTNYLDDMRNGLAFLLRRDLGCDLCPQCSKKRTDKGYSGLIIR